MPVSSEECQRVRASIPEATIEEWREDWRSTTEEQNLVPIPEDVWFAGTWLKIRLVEAGCDPDLASEICMAVGQRQAMIKLDGDEHVWGPAIEALANYGKGEWELPGEELAVQLLKERFGDPPDKKAMLDWVLNSPTGRGALRSMIGGLGEHGHADEV